MIIHNGPVKGINPYIVSISLAVTAVFALYTLIWPEPSAAIINQTRTFITLSMNAWYVILAGFFLAFCAWLVFSRHGDIRLGDDHERPEFGYFAWFAMLYAAGQGIGIIFWSIAEPMFHFSGGTPFNEAVGNEVAAEVAMKVSFFHWGLNAWAIYCVVGISLAFVAYRLKKPLSIRYTLYPLLGEKVNGWMGVAVDVIAVFATLFGIATSLGLGVQQINAGLNAIWDIPQNLKVQLVLIVVISACALISVLTGLKRGIKYLSITNMWLTIALLAFFLLLGPTVYIVKLLVSASMDYMVNLVPMNAFIEPTQSWGDTDASWMNAWQGWWTVFYWGWWMSWAPFVGVFIARVSRGRTIREFVLGVVGVSSLLSFVWLAAYGGTALDIDLTGAGGIADVVKANVADALYATIAGMDVGTLGYLATIAGTLLVCTYFITSSDSGTLVLTTIMSEGNPNPLHRHRVFWGVIQGVLAAVLLVAGGNAALSTLQTASITAALPFSLLMVLMCFALIKGVKAETRLMTASVSLKGQEV
ncbi:BCCT family transporter [Marinobacter sp. X15-166B]|uniref:BCCT family transporter n=1 Tax=Marinobacter sp. X15-166B TaxID=1897620 RepID=UPI00085C9232|nr:BCCT family transporter [Marinobacter sp. X15-166B]OEY65444.1 choline transporter [Marinobacter sp. X15-166B]